MAEPGRREVVGDQLAFNAREQAPNRSLQTNGIRNPMQTAGGLAFDEANMGLKALGSLRTAVSGVLEAKRDDMITEGKILQMQGVAENDVRVTGNKYTAQGYETLSSVDQANKWFLNEASAIDTNTRSMDPTEYAQYLKTKQSEALKDLPTDPAARKVYVAAFQDLAPRLAEAQYKAHNDFNRGKQISTLSQSLRSSAGANVDATRVMPDSDLRVSPVPVTAPIQVGAMDRDVLIKTVLGEASGETELGQAAVMWSLVNRSRDGRWPNKLRDVATQDKQYSTWNSGEGGNSPQRWRPGTPAYERAAMVVDAVLAGRVVDPTGGATHYVAPSGMKGGQMPDWWAQEAGQSNGGLKIGNHLFAGRTRAVASAGPKGTLSFAHSDQTGIEANFKGILEAAAGEFGGNLKIISGHRDADHPVEAAKANGGGEHTHGTASDIDMTGMSDAQRSALVQSLRAKGVMRFGTYSKYPNMLHVDMKDQQGNGSNWFMHDKSNGNMDSAPEWFKEAQHLPVEAAPSSNANGLQSLLNATGMTNEDKAAAAANAMIQDLSDGTDQSFNDLGGFGLLSGLGAPIELLNKVEKAKDAYDKKQMDRWDVDFERERNDLTQKVKAGEFSSPEEIFAVVDEMVQAKRLAPKDAQSLARATIGEWNTRQVDETKRIPIAMHTELAAVYQQVSDRSIDAAAAAEKAQEIGGRFGIEADVTQGLIDEMFKRRESADTKFKNDQKISFDKVKKSDDLKEQVGTALSNDFGLSTLTGNVIVGDKEVPVKQYAIDTLKASETKTIQDLVAKGQMRKEAAPAALTKAIYEKLAKQDIVDEQFGAYLNGALYGNITTKGGNGTGTQLTEDAKHAVDVLMQMHNNPAIGPDYVAKMIPNSYTRALFNTVLLMDGGRYGFDQTLLKAHELMQNKNFNPDDRINMDTNFQKMVSKGTSDAIEAAVTRPGWFGGSELTPDQRRDVVKNNRAAEEYVKAQANLYHIQFPQTDPEVNIKQAVEDLGRDAMVVGGNVIIGRTDQKQRLDQVMGLEGADKTLPQQAINATVERLGPSVFGALWDEAKKKSNPSLWEMATQPIGMSYEQTNRTPPYYATYNPQSGVMAVQLVEEKNGYKNPIGNPMYINVRASGARYKAALRLPSALGNTIRVVKDDLVDKKQGYEKTLGAAESGAAMGEMIK